MVANDKPQTSTDIEFFERGSCSFSPFRLTGFLTSKGLPPKTWISRLEMCFAFRLHLGRSIANVCHNHNGNPFLQQTVAADLRVFKKLFKAWRDELGFLFDDGTVGLVHCGVHAKQSAVWFPWSLDL